MKKYRVFCIVESYSVLPNKGILEFTQGFENEEIKFKIKNIDTENLVGRVFSKSLSIITELDEENITNAIDKCYAYSESLLNKIAFETSMPVKNLKVMMAMEITKGVEVIEIVNYDYDVLSKIGSREIELTQLTKIIQNANDDRIDRAMHWYRKALNENDLLDIFSYLWIALETLNPHYLKVYPDALEKTSCKKCGEERTFIGTAPLKEFFKSIQREDLYSKSRQIRNQITHGFEDISTLHNKLIDIIDDLCTATRLAIFQIIKIESLSKYPQSVLGYSENIVFETLLKISNYITDDNHPRYFVPSIKTEVEMKYYNDELVIVPTVKTDIFNHGCGLAGIGWDMHGGDPGYPIKKMQIKIMG